MQRSILEKAEALVRRGRRVEEPAAYIIQIILLLHLWGRLHDWPCLARLLIRMARFGIRRAIFVSDLINLV
jgi:hypothetical protein